MDAANLRTAKERNVCIVTVPIAQVSGVYPIAACNQCYFETLSRVYISTAAIRLSVRNLQSVR